jgi:hypothetical protein
VGIGHAGTLISAILFLFRQKWRTAVNRSAEAMTLFAVMCAGLFPLIHMGRPWLAYWMAPYPNTRGSLWVNFRSPLIWDFFAISTYFLISLVFWYIGLLPDLATCRDRAQPGWRKRLFGFFALGWNGSFRTWHRYEMVYLLLAGLARALSARRAAWEVSFHLSFLACFAKLLAPLPEASFFWRCSVFCAPWSAGAPRHMPNHADSEGLGSHPPSVSRYFWSAFMAIPVASETDKPELSQSAPADDPEVTSGQGAFADESPTTNDRFMLYLLLFVFGLLGATILLDLL